MKEPTPDYQNRHVLHLTKRFLLLPVTSAIACGRQPAACSSGASRPPNGGRTTTAAPVASQTEISAACRPITSSGRTSSRKWRVTGKRVATTLWLRRVLRNCGVALSVDAAAPPHVESEHWFGFRVIPPCAAARWQG